MWCEDWRQAAPGDVAALLEAEHERWLGTLGWDIAPSLVMAEQGRRSGRVPGFLARAHDGTCAGWTFFSVEHGTLSLGVLSAQRVEVAGALLDVALGTPEAAAARRDQGFLYPASAAVAAALADRRFALAPQRFLARDCARETPVTPAEGAGRAYGNDDLTQVAKLLARAYAGTPAALAFAPEARLEQWVGYVQQITQAGACGPFLHEASIVVPGERGDRPKAAILVTATTPGTWHIAQVAVDQSCRRAGLARHLVSSTCAAARAAGAREVTLVVDERNVAARALYASLGFVDRAALLFGSRPRVGLGPRTNPGIHVN